MALEVATREAPAHPGDSVVRSGQVVGTVSSAAWGHRVAKNLALAYVAPDCAALGTDLEIQMLGQNYPAVVCAEAQYDPSFTRVRS